MNDQQLALVKAMATLVAGMHVPISLGMPLGVAKKGYLDVRGVLNDFGWSSAEEIEERITRILEQDDER